VGVVAVEGEVEGADEFVAGAEGLDEIAAKVATGVEADGGSEAAGERKEATACLPCGIERVRVGIDPSEGRTNARLPTGPLRGKFAAFGGESQGERVGFPDPRRHLENHSPSALADVLTNDRPQTSCPPSHICFAVKYSWVVRWENEYVSSARRTVSPCWTSIASRIFPRPASSAHSTAVP